MTLVNCALRRGQSESTDVATVLPVVGVLGHHVAQPRQVLGVQTLQLHHGGVDPPRIQPQHVGDAAGHARGHVASHLAEHHHAAAGHVFARVVADTLDDGQRSGVARGEPLPTCPRRYISPDVAP